VNRASCRDRGSQRHVCDYENCKLISRRAPVTAFRRDTSLSRWDETHHAIADGRGETHWPDSQQNRRASGCL
jgi:hypothetical protein